MYLFRPAFFVYCSCYYFHFFVLSVELFDILKRKPNENVVGTANCRLSDEKIQKLNILAKEQLNLYATAQWNYHTNKNDETMNEALRSSVRLFLYQNLLKESAKNMSLVFGMKYEDLLTSVFIIRDRSVCHLDSTEFKTAIMLKSKLKTLINEFTVCEYQTTNQLCDITADEIKYIMVNSSDPAELKYYWKAWHNHTSFNVRIIYIKYIGVLNRMAKLNNASNEVNYHMKPYADDEYHLNAERMYETIRPLYLQLYTHVRKVLRTKFGSVAVSANGPIPVHLLGSVLGQPWINLLPLLTHEYDDDHSKAKTPKQLFDQANGFFTSIGMGSVPNSVWSASVFEEKKNFADCTPSSWDMYKSNDFRIKMCFRDTIEDVYTMHKQLGLVHYFLAYKKQPIAFQHIPDEVFVDGILNALTLSVRYQDFIDRFNDSSYNRHGYLLRMALEKVAILPFAHAAHQWHSTAFKGSFAPRRMNDFWWSKRIKYEGVVSPIAKNKDKSTNSNYRPFDPSASYNALMELPSIRYFLGPIIEFQIFKALCKICGEYDSKSSDKKNLYECNLRGFKRIGKIIKSVMSKGSSLKWQILFEKIVGHRRLEIEPILEYFKPLHDHLYMSNNETNEYIGWK